MGKAFIIDGKAKQAVEIITELLATPGEIIIEHSDIKAIMAQPGAVFISTGSGAGTDRVLRACKDALSNSCEEAIIKEATKVLIKVTGPSGLLLKEVNDGINIIRKSVTEDTEIIFGVTRDDNLPDQAEVTLLAAIKQKTELAPVIDEG